MISTGEKAFPRGGRNPALSTKRSKPPNSFSLINTSIPRAKKKIKKKKDKIITNKKRKSEKQGVVKSKVDKKLIIKDVDDLNPAVLHEGVLVLGVVSQTSEKYVNISLPGGLRGIVTMLNVSEMYKNLVMKATEKSEIGGLRELFKVGDIVPTKVISVSEEDKRKFFVSLDPKLINSKINEMETGLVLVGSVKSEEDHGYVIDFGIPSVSAFLNFNKMETTEKLSLGKLVRCAVIKCTNSQGLSSVELSQLQSDLKKASLSLDSSCPVHSYVPGLQFNLTVTKVLHRGVEVSYRDDKSFKGFIHEDYLPALFPKLSKIEIGKQYTGMLLYVKPLVNIPYFKIVSSKPDNYIYQYGKIVKGKVIKTAGSGVTFKIGKKLIPMKCFVPLSKLAESKKIIEHDLSMDSVYPANKVIEKIRLRKIDYMKRCYVGATDKTTIEEKYFAITDLNCGDIVPGKIKSVGKSFFHVQIGNITGILSFGDVTDIPVRNPASKFKIGQKVKARVTEMDVKSLYLRLTMKPTLLNKKMKILMNYDKAKKNDCYVGTIAKVGKSLMTVKFFNRVAGRIHKNFTPHREESSLFGHYTPGQLVKCYVRKIVGNDLQLSLIPKEEMKSDLKVGQKYEVSVTSVEQTGLIVRILSAGSDYATGIIPSELISGYPGLGKAMAVTYSANQKLEAHLVQHLPGSSPVFALSDAVSRFHEVLAQEDVDADSLFTIGRIYPFVFTHFGRKSNRLILAPLVSTKGVHKFTVDMNQICDGRVFSFQHLPVKKYQLVYGKILWMDGKEARVSLKMSDVWDKNYHASLALLDVYVDGVRKLFKHHVEEKEDYTKRVRLGSQVSSIVKEKSNSVVYEVANTINPMKKKEEGEVISGAVVWVRADKKLVCVNTSASDVNENQDDNFELVDTSHRARIVYIGEEVIVAVLKGKGNGKLVFLPRKRHVNDFQNPPSPYEIGCMRKIWVERGKLNNLVGIDRELILAEEKKIWNTYEDNLRKSIRSLKRKLPVESANGKIRRVEDNDSDMEIVVEKLSGKAKVKEEKNSSSDEDVRCEYVGGIVNGQIPTDEIKKEVEDIDECVDLSTVSDIMNPAEVDIKSENESNEEPTNDKDKDLYSKERIFLSSSSESEADDDDEEQASKFGNDFEKNLSVGFNWDVLKKRELLSGAHLKPEEDSSSDDEEDSKYTKKKRIRLTKSEKEEKAKMEEERLRVIEERLMKPDLEPETADDFDRAVLAKPNSSALWVKYMAFHLQATEIEKAKAVARRALKTITFTEEQEKLNVWIALINLENLYGNEESLNKTVEEALMRNEPYHVHLHLLNMNGQSGKFPEMERIGNMMLKKYKDVENLWEDVGQAYYKAGRLESARHVLQRALPLLDKKRHVALISRFAQMENKSGSSERAQTLYETILASFPKRVDVWSCYADMLIKSNLIDLARQVLERATSQSLPPKKMKVLFKKFIDFEEKHGSPENVEKVRKSAVDYVEAVVSRADK